MMNEKLAKQLESLSTPELVELQKYINQLVRGNQKQLKKNLLNEIQFLAKEKGLAIEDVIWKNVEEKKKKQYPPKYQNPLDPTQTWTGLGKRPKWVQAQLDAGKTLPDLLISN
jgi:DNA-binding protein H-NS